MDTGHCGLIICAICSFSHHDNTSSLFFQPPSGCRPHPHVMGTDSDRRASGRYGTYSNPLFGNCSTPDLNHLPPVLLSRLPPLLHHPRFRLQRHYIQVKILPNCPKLFLNPPDITGLTCSCSLNELLLFN